MDRIDYLRQTRQSSAGPHQEIESALFSAPSALKDHALFGPLHYEPGYSYPLIVWLHGHGDNERQLLRIMPVVSMRNYVAAAPRGVDTSDCERSVYGWPQSDSSIQHARRQVLTAIEAAEAKYHVDRSRVFLAGFNEGGTMAFRIAMSHPERFAGVLSFGGPFPKEDTPLRNLTAARRVPIFLAVGRDSQRYPSEQVCENLRLFHSAGLLASMRQYPVGDELSPQMLADVDRWIIELISTGHRREPEPDRQWLVDSD